ncbi:hypothetical protein QCN29_19825 [Streptomyces sp. HNM0663]|uniref:Secreted protein n=1 Tax=Streptomyces chengmaiensis TaxID=3040919 RepID=A0ABT6HQL0_9ACTN|nr:hypothetical protein [Streptomyces chengmaiensis]MDH2390998.1 hypothetical protein [Streptomyces chengmaiensis]
MKLRYAVAAAAAGMAAVLGTSLPAQAAGNGGGATQAAPVGDGALADYTHCRYVYRGGDLAGTACFQSYGDKFLMKDNKADGLRVVAEWRTDYGRSGECHWTGTADGGWGECNYNMRESGDVKFRVVVRNGADGANKAAGAWSGWMPIGG